MKKITFKEFSLAISTPLASIFGSGFLVMVPILVGAVGEYALYAMIGIIMVAYSVGAVIRFNIRNVEPLLTKGLPSKTAWLEKASDISLIVAYIVSVSLYLHILSAFVLTGMGMDSDFKEDILTTSIILIIMTIGMTKGLKPLEILEKYALIVTLIIVMLLIFAFGWYDLGLITENKSFIVPTPSEHSTWEVVGILAGMLIVVQGFETSRYLGNSYTAQTRILTSKYSQIIAAFVYIVFIALALPVTHLLKGVYDDNSLITLVGYVSVFLVTPLIVVAALSQFSAAVADTLAATGNIEEVASKFINSKQSYLLVGLSAVIITWSIHTLEILALASRAFALYYLLQTLVAFSLSSNTLQKAFFLLLAVILLFITLFAIPAG
jgi:hypothetical protein